VMRMHAARIADGTSLREKNEEDSIFAPFLCKLHPCVTYSNVRACSPFTARGNFDVFHAGSPGIIILALITAVPCNVYVAGERSVSLDGYSSAKTRGIPPN